MPVLNIAKYMGGGGDKIVPVIFIFWILMWMFYFSVLFLEDLENLRELRELSSDVVNWTHCISALFYFDLRDYTISIA